MLGRPPVVDREHRGAGPVGEPPRLRVVGVEVAEDEAAAVQEQQRGRRAGGDVEPAGHAVGVDVLDPVDRLARPRAAACRGRVARIRASSAGPNPGSVTLGTSRPQRERRHRLRVQASLPGRRSRASSSSTTDGSSLVNTGAGLSTGVPTSPGVGATAGRRSSRR